MTYPLRTALPLALVLVALGAGPAAADEPVPAGDFTGESADPTYTAASAETCADPDSQALLAPFKDRSLYFTAPGGDFEQGGQGWELEGGASIADTTTGLGILGGSHSLVLPVGAQATSPEFCVDERYPHFRFTQAQLGTGKGKLRVSVVYPGLDKNVRRAKDLDPRRGSWSLTDRIDLQPRYGLKKGGWRLVALRFTVTNGDAGSDVRIDDVLVDPRGRS
jgi:hypothetical protein